jgi:signal transduction histidine kinase
MENVPSVCQDRKSGPTIVPAPPIRLYSRHDVENRLGGAEFAHDFNNFLSGILGSLTLLKRRLSEGRMQELDQHIETASRCAIQAAALTDRLLAGASRHGPAPTDLRPLIAFAVENLRSTTSSSIDIEVVDCPNLWQSPVDPVEFENMLLNVCMNSRDAMPDGGRLSITSKNTVLNRSPMSGIRMPPRDYVTLTVTDTGIGMSPDVIAHAFDALFTTKAPGFGTGLGLWRAREFVEKAGGEIGIQSVPGIGTSVFIYLPRHSGSRSLSSE